MNALFSFHNTEGAIQSCNATAYVMSAALSPGALIALLVCMLILIGKLINALMNKHYTILYVYMHGFTSNKWMDVRWMARRMDKHN